MNKTGCFVHETAENDKNDNRVRNSGPCCREEATRTPDPYVPNVVRYQLRYFSRVKNYESLLM